MRKSSNIHAERASEINSYNDYVQLTKSYLRSYYQLKTTLNNLAADKAAFGERLEKYLDTTAGISKYGLQPTGSSNALGSGVVERTVEKREQIRQRLASIEDNITSVKVVIDKINHAYELLPAIEQEIIRMHYFERMNYGQISGKLNMSSRWVSQKGNNAVSKMAIMLFGSITAMPTHAKFLFAG